MATANTDGVLLKAEEPKVIKIPNFSRMQAGYVEGGLHLQDTALKTIAVRVFPCGRKDSVSKDYVCVVFRKLWLRTFSLNFHCTVSIIDIYGERKYSQTCGMEELQQDFEIDRFVKRSTLFENDIELLPNDTLTVLCEVSYTMPSSQRSSKIWSVLSRLYAWNSAKKDGFSETREKAEMCSLVVETMDKGEFLLPTPLSYFKIETEANESSEEEFNKNIQESEKTTESITFSLLGNAVKDASIDFHISSSTDSKSIFPLSICNQTTSLENCYKKNLTTSDKRDLSSLMSDVNSASGKKDVSGLISAVAAVLSNTNLLAEKTCKQAITKESSFSCISDSSKRTPSSNDTKTFFGTDYKNKMLSEIQVSDLSMLSNDRIPDLQRNISRNGTKIKRIKSKSETTVASNTKILDHGSRKIVQGSDVCDASPVFACMLKTPMLENATKRVILRNVDADTFDNFLYYLETHEVIAETFEKLCDLYELADQYEVRDLMGDCAQHLFQSLDVHNFLTVLELAEMHSDDKLQKKVHKFFLQNEMDILLSLQNDPTFLKWYSFRKKEDISPTVDMSDDEIEVCENDLNFYR